MAKIDRAVLLAAGRGTRMRELTVELPKPMIKVRGKPILLHIIEGLQAAGIKDFLIIVGYHGDAVRSYFGDGTCFGLQIKYATQVVQDGTGRVVDLARDFVGQSPFIAEMAHFRCAMPWRHIAPLRHRGKGLAMPFHLVVVHQRKRRRLARTMAGCAVAEQNRGDVTRERHLCRRRDNFTDLFRIRPISSLFTTGRKHTSK